MKLNENIFKSKRIAQKMFFSTKHEQAHTANILTIDKAAFTLAEGRQGTQVCSYTRVTAKGYQDCHCEALGETIQLIKKTGLEKQNAGLTHVTNLFPYSPISLFP